MVWAKQTIQEIRLHFNGWRICLHSVSAYQPKEKAWRCDEGKEGSKKRKRDEGEETCIGSGEEEKPKPNTKKERAKAHRDSLVHKGTFYKDSIVVGIDPGRCAPVYAYRRDGRSFKLSRGQLYAKSGITTRKKRQSKTEEPLKPFLTVL